MGPFSPTNFIGGRRSSTPPPEISRPYNERGYTTSIFWDSSLPEILPRQVRDAALRTTDLVYDAFGNLLTATDSNQTKRETRYDNLQRPTHIYASGANSADPAPDQTIAYLSFGSPSLQRTVVTTKIDAARSTSSDSYFDGMGRIYLEVERGGSFNKAVSHAFNTAGVESKTTIPYSGTTFSLTQPLTQYNYDAVGRLVNATFPGNFTLSTTYALWTAARRSSSGGR